MDNRCFRLRQRPSGRVTSADLEWCTEQVPDLRPGQALVRNTLLSLDPTNRIWMSAVRSYLPPVPIGAVMRGIGIGTVVASQREDMAVGDVVTGFIGWQDYAIAGGPEEESPLTVLPNPLPAPASLFLGVLGHTGVTAYLGLELGAVKPGQTVVVSAAAGAVGSIAGQLFKSRGVRVVGIAGGPAKCKHVTENLGFDACVDYKAPDWQAQLDAATPDGIDVDFENVGGEIMDAVLARINIGARVVLCGMISDYNAMGEGGAVYGLQNIGQLIMQRATVHGFLVLDHLDRYPEIIGELVPLLMAGTLHHDETFVDGLENAIDAINGLFAGANTGKLLVRVADGG
ncbi:MAG: NADP-dependent oxidoreductase [Sporichthyaceae bacterium]